MSALPRCCLKRCEAIWQRKWQREAANKGADAGWLVSAEGRSADHCLVQSRCLLGSAHDRAGARRRVPSQLCALPARVSAALPGRPGVWRVSLVHIRSHLAETGVSARWSDRNRREEAFRMTQQSSDQSYSFNPNEHLMQIKSGQTSKDYLPVQWRLVWFRSLCPQGTIETELVLLDLDRETEEEVFVWNNEKRCSEKVIKTAKGIAIFRATVKDGKGGVATGTKTEKAASFADWVEKAETGAIGRALAALGYGTQFTGDEFNENHRIVDSPVERVPSTESNSASKGNGQSDNVGTNGNGMAARKPGAVQTGEETITEQQISSIQKLCERLKKPVPENLRGYSFERGKETIQQLSQEYRARKAS